MKEKAMQELHVKKYSLKHEQAVMNGMVEDFKEFVSKATSYEIATFCPGKIKAIQDEIAKVQQLDETVRMLNFILN